ncbi:hypothetical protein KCU90_g6300, partial [Aureobasidium melanogenum]
MAGTVAVQFQLGAADDLQPRIGRTPLLVAAYLVVQAVRFAVALPDQDAFHCEAVRARLERKMFETVALFRCPP